MMDKHHTHLNKSNLPDFPDHNGHESNPSDSSTNSEEIPYTPTHNVSSQPLAPQRPHGEMAARVNALDWSSTPLGPRDQWPGALRSAVDLCLHSRFPMHIWWGPKLIYIYNDAHIPILGQRHPRALGQAAATVWSEIWPVLDPQVHAVMVRGESTWNQRTHVVLERNGSPEDAWFTWSYSPIHDDTGRVTGLMCIATEETELVLAERRRDKLEAAGKQQREEERTKAQEVQASMAAIVESSDDAIIGKTLDGIITTWNDGARRLFGYSAGEIVGQSILRLIPPDRVHEEVNIRARLSSGQRMEHFETIRVAKDGRRIDVSLTVSPIKNTAGQIIGGSKIVRDITARKKAEESMARQTDELARSNMELERFAHVASHDLQEPMRTVQSFAQLLWKDHGGGLRGDAQEYLKFIVGGVQRMQSLINDLLSYSRANSQGAAFGPVDCREICAKVLENLQASLNSNHAAVTVDPLPVVIGDGTQLGQVFQNLLGNAMKFHGQRVPEIHLSATETAGEWIFSITDNGIGIAPEYFERIFIIFQRLHTIEEYGGTGIGLAICKKIIERHGGRIWVESVVGQGSTFYFSILKREKAHHGQTLVNSVD
jgi:PAS domain S-box-containing protein